MPHVRIFEQDNTGAEYTGSETVVFVPGSIEIQPDLEDNNHCVYISNADYNKLGKILKLKKEDGTSALEKTHQKGTLAFLQTCLSHGMDVIYCHVAEFGTKVSSGEVTADGSPQAPTYQVTILLPGKKVTDEVTSGNHHRWGYDINLSFLLDKDNYDIKFLTTGCLNAIFCTLNSDDVLQDSDSKVQAQFDFSVANALCELANSRKDCAALLSVDYDTSKVKDGNLFAQQLSNALNSAADPKSNPNIKDGNALITNESSQESYGAILVPNFTATISVDSKTESLTMPSVWGYLTNYGDCLKSGQEWLPIANSTRGSVEALGKPDLTVTKYFMDQTIIKDANGISFNGIVNLRPYGGVIWGDRTLLKLQDTVKATAYLSLRMLICDVSKRAYQAAIRNTYESNNDITWFNFKSRIVDLLGEIVAAGVLSNYEVTKLSSSSYNTIVCKITLYPNLPVENFDIYINLENAEITTTNSEEE